MLDVNKLENFFTVLKQYHAARDGDELSWIVKPYSDQLKQEVEDKGVSSEKEGNELLIDLKNQPLGQEITFSTEKNFLKVFGSAEMSKTVVVVANNCSYLIRNSDGQVQTSATISAGMVLLCENTFAYFKLYEKLKSNSFSQHHNEAQSDIVLYSSSRGIFKINYKGDIPQFSEPITLNVEELLVYVVMVHYKPHLVHAIIDCSSDKRYCRLRDIIDHHKLILENTVQSYDMAISQFDFDKVRNALHREKEKFFANIRDITSKFFTQIIAIPLSASATAFASYKLDGNASLNVAILSGFLLFTILYLIAQASYYNDLSILKKDFERDFDYIEKFSGISSSEIQSERTKLESKIGSSKAIICFSMIAIVLINLLVSRYVLIQIMRAHLPPCISSHF